MPNDAYIECDDPSQSIKMKAGATYTLMDGNSQTIVNESGTVSMTLNGDLGKIGMSAGALANFVMDGIGNTICLQDTAGNVQVCVNVATQVITIRSGPIAVILNQPVGGMTLEINPPGVGIIFVGGTIAFNISGVCLDVGLFIQYFIDLLAVMEDLPITLPEIGDMFTCP